MTDKLAKIAIESAFATGWAAAGYSSYKVFYQNVSAAKTTVAPWASIHILPGDQKQISMASTPCFRQSGIIDVRIRVPLNSGTNTLNEIISAVKGIFMGKTISSTIFCHNATSAIFESDTYFQANVSFPYHWDENYSI